MSLLTIEKSVIYDSMCMNLLDDKQIQFACVINNKGRIVTGQFDKIPNGFDKDFEVFLMEIALEFSMKREFDNKFGKVEYVFSKRSGANVTCIPVSDDVLVVISQKYVEPKEIIKQIMFFLEPNFKEFSVLNEFV